MTPTPDPAPGFDLEPEESDDRHPRFRQVQVEKIESLGLLARGVAHDFNNLLMTILGNTDLALSTLDSDAHELRGYLEEVKSASDRAADRCRLLLAYAGRGKFGLIVIDLNRVIDDARAALAQSVPPSVEIAFELESDLPRVEGGVSELRRIMLQLVRNAIEAIAERPAGQIRVSTGLAARDSRLDHALGGAADPQRDYLFLEVADNGAGMDFSTRSRVFDPFFTTKGAGRGLGMATVFGIVRAHAALIDIESLPEHGTRVRIYFPALPRPGALQLLGVDA